MGAGEVAEVSSRPYPRGSAFVDSGEGRSVVGGIGYGGVLDWMVGRHDGDLSHQGRLFEVAVGDGSAHVGGRDQAPLDLLGEGIPPEIALAGGVVVHTSHSCFSRICGP